MLELVARGVVAPTFRLLDEISAVERDEAVRARPSDTCLVRMSEIHSGLLVLANRSPSSATSIDAMVADPSRPVYRRKQGQALEVQQQPSLCSQQLGLPAVIDGEEKQGSTAGAHCPEYRCQRKDLEVPPMLSLAQGRAHETDPPIWRRLRVPGKARTCASGSGDLQTAMGWTNSHLHTLTGRAGGVYRDRAANGRRRCATSGAPAWSRSRRRRARPSSTSTSSELQAASGTRQRKCGLEHRG